MNTVQINEAQVLEALRHVIDPELDCNIVDLGLIYGIAINGSSVAVTMTLTTPGCPMHESIAQGVHETLLALPGVSGATVVVVWDPPWHPGLMSQTGAERLSR